MLLQIFMVLVQSADHLFHSSILLVSSCHPLCRLGKPSQSLLSIPCLTATPMSMPFSKILRNSHSNCSCNISKDAQTFRNRSQQSLHIHVADPGGFPASCLLLNLGCCRDSVSEAMDDSLSYSICLHFFLCLSYK